MANDFFDVVMPIITLLGEKGIFWIAAIISLLFISPKTRKAGVVMGISLLVSVIVVNLVMKPVVARERPCWLNEGIKMLVNIPKDYSFPSGHTNVCFVGAVSLLMCGWKKLGAAAMVLAGLVGFSRMYLYVHFFTDVVVGAAIGALATAAVYFIVDKYICKGKNELEFSDFKRKKLNS